MPCTTPPLLRSNSPPLCSRADRLIGPPARWIRFKWTQTGLGFSCPKRHKHGSRAAEANNAPIFPGGFSEDSHPANTSSTPNPSPVTQAPAPLKPSLNRNEHLPPTRKPLLMVVHLPPVKPSLSGNHPLAPSLRQHCPALRNPPPPALSVAFCSPHVTWRPHEGTG